MFPVFLVSELISSQLVGLGVLQTGIRTNDEITIRMLLRHKNILEVKGFVNDKNEVKHIVTEWMDNGSLEHLMSTGLHVDSHKMVRIVTWCFC